MSEEPEKTTTKDIPLRPWIVDEEPVDEKPIKIYPFSIDKLCEDNARYWFHAMEKQLRGQNAWQAIGFYAKVGKDEYARILSQKPSWSRVDLKADMIIENGLSPSTVLDVKSQPNAGRKWDYLKKTFMETSNTRKALKLMRMANWTWDQSKNEREAYREIKQMAEEFTEMNGGKTINIDDLTVLWYLRGLGDKYATLRDTVMSSDATLNEEYVLSRVEDLRQLRDDQGDKASRADGKQRQRSIKCYACGKKGHISKECKQDSSDTDGDKRENSKGQKNGRNRKKKPTKHKGRSAEDHEMGDSPDEEEYSSRAVEVSHQMEVEYGSRAIEVTHIDERATFVKEDAYRMKTDSRWCFDSGATSMSTGDKGMFEYLDMTCKGNLTIASGTRMPIEGRGIVKFSLPNGKKARLGGVIYVPGLAENLLSLEVLHLAGFESRGSIKGYELRKDGKVIAKGKRIGRSTYLEAVKHVNALLVGPGVAKRKQHARLALSADEETAIKQRLIHRRLGHPGRKRFNNCVNWMDMEELRINKRDKLLDDNCEVCIKAKQVKKQGHVPVPKARRPLQRVYMDFWGPNREGAGPERYFLSLIDDCTRYSWLFIKTDRRTESVIYTLDVWSRQVERQAGQMLLIIRTDNAAEFIALKPWAKSKGIELEFIESYTPPQNGVAERFNRVILDIARALLFDAKISKIYWKYAVITANYLRNRITQLRDSAEDEDGEDRTPYELWHGHKPDLTHLRAWGCRVLFHTQADSKLDSRVAEGTFMMYGKSDKQYFVLPRGGQELRLVTNPEFREQESGYCLKPFQQLQQPDRPLPPAQQEAPAQEHQPNPMPIEIPAEREAREKEPTERPSYHQTMVSDSNEEGPAPERPDTGSMTDKPEGEVNVPPTETTSPDVRRSARIRQPSKMMMESYQQQQESREQRGAKRRTEGEDGLDNRPAQRLRARLAQKENARMALATELLIGDCEFEVTEKARPALEKNGIRIPRTYKEAVNDPIYGSKWKEAIHKELIALMSFGTWRVIPRKEAEGTISSTRWVFDVKIGLDGRIDRFKARLVARGNEQSDNDFDETFAPVFRLDSLRILVAMAARYGLVAHVLDASNAFVGSDLDKPNCMEIPEGLQDFDPEAGQGGMVLELMKSLYGLRQSANLWHRKISQFLKKIGFKPITADPSVFINGRGLIIGLYVDDIIIFGKHEHGIEAVKQKLKEFHPMTDSGRVQKLLGIRFTWGRDRLIGRLMFLVTATRPDIAFAINQLSQYLAEPGQVHLGAAKHVLRYVKGTIDYGLVYGAKGRCQQGLIAYSDSAYANSKENRSTTGFIFMIDAAPIVWSSRKQSLTAQSSTEAEYIAASEAAKQAIWIRHFLYAIGKEAIYHGAPTTIYEDNQGAIKIAENPINHPKTKHIAVRYHAIREHINNGEIRLEYLSTDKMTADGLTKATNHISQGRLVDGLGLA
ncbi:uncharacterized protein EURHEDRAFT_510308 [Aspergillus ruber CBS 135680]|uniref:Uncharacterized protein n=1 Tax=Aspergillus ruber (strain CBS 135680) TaxID=1388766 RepID=A0A017S0R5_ASPRC|nr:uncharacterized protein EURHEDRAFT_510308 [Aspergillus ruber CBS 135680]EYE90608.1 hypothetical protein EURHEDRAFT_510308 [Aspergillus ruber CBS 135680]